MPALRKYKPSVAPVPMIGTTGTPGHMLSVICSTGFITSAESGDGGLGLGSATASP